MRAHHDQVRFHRLRRPQNAVECIAGRHERTAGDLIDCDQRFCHISEKLACRVSLLFDQVRWLIVIDNVDERQLGIDRMRDQDSSTQCAV